MSKIHSNSFAAKWIALGSGAKTVIISTVFLVVVGGISLPVYLNYQNQQALILAEQQEQERLAAEQAEAERVAAEEQAKLEQEAQAEAERLAAEAEASRLEAERVEQERIAAEEEQVRLEAEAQAEAERTAAEKVAAEQARQQTHVAEQQPIANDGENSDSQSVNPPGSASHNESSDTGKDNSPALMEEPTSGKGREQADRMGGVWAPEMEGWVFIDAIGDYIYIYKNGGSSVLTGEEINIAKQYLK